MAISRASIARSLRRLVEICQPTTIRRNTLATSASLWCLRESPWVVMDATVHGSRGVSDAALNDSGGGPVVLVVEAAGSQGDLGNGASPRLRRSRARGALWRFVGRLRGGGGVGTVRVAGGTTVQKDLTWWVVRATFPARWSPGR